MTTKKGQLTNAYDDGLFFFKAESGPNSQQEIIMETPALIGINGQYRV